MEELVFCTKCKELVESDPHMHIYKTGFRRVGGSDYHLSSCDNTYHLCNSVTHEQESEEAQRYPAQPVFPNGLI